MREVIPCVREDIENITQLGIAFPRIEHRDHLRGIALLRLVMVP
jgi:hypothetical protein